MNIYLHQTNKNYEEEISKLNSQIELLYDKINILNQTTQDLLNFNNDLSLLKPSTYGFSFTVGDGKNEKNTTVGQGTFHFYINDKLHFAYFYMYIDTMSWGTSTLQDLPLIPKYSQSIESLRQIMLMITNKLGKGIIINIPVIHCVTPNGIRELKYVLDLRINTSDEVVNPIYFVATYGGTLSESNVNLAALSRLRTSFYPIQWD